MKEELERKKEDNIRLKSQVGDDELLLSSTNQKLTVTNA